MRIFDLHADIGWDILHQLDFEIDDIAKKFKVIQNRFRIPHPNMIKGSLLRPARFFLGSATASRFPFSIRNLLLPV